MLVHIIIKNSYDIVKQLKDQRAHTIHGLDHVTASFSEQEEFALKIKHRGRYCTSLCVVSLILRKLS